MNLGTANKWIDLMETAAIVGDVVYDNSQLGFTVRGKVHRSPFGLLADFLNPAGWRTESVMHTNLVRNESWMYGIGLNVMTSINITQDLWIDNIHQFPEEYKKRCKLKSDMYDVYSEFDLNACSWRSAAAWVAANYSNI
jgi:hypothetical protein